MGVRVGGTLVGGRAFVAAIATIACAIVAATAAPVAKANGTCGGHDITNTNRTPYGSNEKVVIDVWGSNAPHPSSVVIGGTGWALSSSTTYSDHNSSIWVHAYLARGTWNFSLTVSGQLCGNGSFTIY